MVQSETAAISVVRSKSPIRIWQHAGRHTVEIARVRWRGRRNEEKSCADLAPRARRSHNGNNYRMGRWPRGVVQLSQRGRGSWPDRSNGLARHRRIRTRRKASFASKDVRERFAKMRQRALNR